MLREITAAEELSARSAEALVDALLVGGTVPLDEMTLADVDRCVSALYRALYGETVVCHIPCSACDRQFETGFALDDWLADLQSGPEVVRTGATTYAVPGVLSFRLPTRRDLAAASAEGGPDALRRRCVLSGDGDHPDLEAAMMRAGPLLDDDIAASCPHCGAEQSFRMRLDSYLMAALARERPVVLREVHHIARSYAWTRTEIMALPRSERREFVRLILSDRPVREVS